MCITFEAALQYVLYFLSVFLLSKTKMPIYLIDNKREIQPTSYQKRKIYNMKTYCIEKNFIKGHNI